MQPTKELVSNALTAMQEQPMKEITPNIKVWAKWLRLETFGEPGLELLVRRCAEFAGPLAKGQQPRWLSILGKSGTGKTHCAKRLWSLHEKFSWSHTRYVGEVIYWPKVIAQLREAVREGAGTGRLLDMGNWPLLVLDDVGAERDSTGFAAEQLNLLLGMRVGKWTVITSNLLLEGLSAIDDRIASRIVREQGNLVIEMKNTRDFGARNS